MRSFDKELDFEWQKFVCTYKKFSADIAQTRGVIDEDAGVICGFASVDHFDVQIQVFFAQKQHIGIGRLFLSGRELSLNSEITFANFIRA